jgi:hypothetical protein
MNFDFITFASILGVALPIVAILSFVFEAQGGNHE